MSRHPLRVRAVIAGVIAQLLIIAAAIGLGDVHLEMAETIATSLLNIGVLVGLVTASEPHTTPMSDPRDDDGHRLIPVRRP